MSTVSGKKSAPGPADFAPVAVTKTDVSPRRANTEPPANTAYLTVSNEIVISDPEKVCETL